MAKEKEEVLKEEEIASREEKAEAEVGQENEDEQSQSEEAGNNAAEERENEVEVPDLNTELAEARDKYLRLYSEFENFRRRTSRERLEMIGTAGREVIEAMIPVLDDFERAVKTPEEKGDQKGVELIYNKFRKVLTDKGLKKMEIKPGDEFDDEYHEAVTQIPAPKKKLEGKIVDVIEPGYFLGEKVIRFAKVVTGAKS